MLRRPNTGIAAQNRQFFEDAKAAMALVAELHDAHPNCGGGPLPGPMVRPLLTRTSWEDGPVELRDGTDPWTWDTETWSWSGPSTREEPDDPESPPVHFEYSVNVVHHDGGLLEIECGLEDDAPAGYEEAGVRTITGWRYPREVWSRGSFLEDALAAAFCRAHCQAGRGGA